MARQNRPAGCGIIAGRLIIYIGTILAEAAPTGQGGTVAALAGAPTETEVVSGPSPRACSEPASGAPAASGAGAEGPRRRVRDLGIVIGRLAPGPLNAI